MIITKLDWGSNYSTTSAAFQVAAGTALRDFDQAIVQSFEYDAFGDSNEVAYALAPSEQGSKFNIQINVLSGSVTPRFTTMSESAIEAVQLGTNEYTLFFTDWDGGTLIAGTSASYGLAIDNTHTFLTLNATDSFVAVATLAVSR